jgi:flavin-dependent dehydrogenase
MMSERLYDVAIIGGGLAGLSFAILCAEENFKVVLFEKEEYPFHKVCGEYISLESRQFLKRLGVDFDALHLPIIKTLHLSDIKGNIFSFNLPLGGFGVSRYFLDNALFEIAKAKGVTIYTDSKVNNVVFNKTAFGISAGDIHVNSKVAAGAYGKRSNLDIKWKRSFTQQKPNSLNNFIGIKYHVKYDHNRSVISLHNFYNGYCGLSKIEDDRSCLCYLTTAENLRQSGNSIDEMQKRLLFENPHLKEIFTTAEFLYPDPLAISQISFEKKSLVEDHVLMLGDAAGMISPLCGNGMSMAMHSAKLAFNCLNDFIAGKVSRDEMEKRYEAEWKNRFSTRLWIGRTVQRFFGGDASTSYFLKTMNKMPVLANWLIRSTHGTPF